MSENVVILSGHLGQDPHIEYSEEGKPKAYFDLAVRKGKDRPPMWVKIRCGGKLAETVGNNLSKGRQVLVNGSLDTGKFEADDGTKRVYVSIYARKIRFLDKKPAPPAQ